MNNIYKQIILKFDDEFRKERLINLIDELYNMVSIDYILIIESLEDIKGTLNISWLETPSLFYKAIINSLWMEQNEDNVKHIIKEEVCKCCNSKPQQGEDQEIKDYFKYLEINNISNINEQ
jgi:hypothetical protein